MPHMDVKPGIAQTGFHLLGGGVGGGGGRRGLTICSSMYKGI